jgi:hypothetical protein
MGRKKNAKPSRSIVLLVPPGASSPGVLSIVEKKQTAYYTFREIPCDVGGRGFAIHRLGLGELYHVRIGKPDHCSCECLGFLRHGRCRHVLGLLALARKGLL